MEECVTSGCESPRGRAGDVYAIARLGFKHIGVFHKRRSIVSRNKLILVSLAGMFMLAQSLYAQKSGLTYTLAFKDF